MKVPLVDLAWQRDQIDADVAVGWAKVLAGTSFIGGAAVDEFERSFAAYTGAAECVGVANGTDAIEIALRALGIGHGDVVALPANTFIATAFAVLRVGATPRLVDVDADTLLIDPAKLDVSGCAAVLPVHLFGQIAPMPAILDMAGAIPIVEDAAQAQGARQGGLGIGSWGVAAATSFYPGKNLGAYGDAGAVTTNNADVGRRMRLIANHGSAIRYEHETLGFNSRLDSLQAVVLSAKLRRLDEWNTMRRQAAYHYGELLKDLDAVRGLETAPGNDHVWHLYPVRLPDRDRVLAKLQAAGIGAAIHYPLAVHQQQAMAFLGHGNGSFPVAEQAAATMLSLPIFPGITESQQEFVVTVLGQAVR